MDDSTREFLRADVATSLEEGWSNDQLASAIAYSAAGPLVTFTGPRVTFLIAGTGMLAGLVILWPALARAPRRRGVS